MNVNPWTLLTFSRNLTPIQTKY